ncbi:MAG TPA: DUF3387 domain-containing protein, partial [bacterium]|nr:DUF3387 domain-containing protein [bacterium]
VVESELQEAEQMELLRLINAAAETFMQSEKVRKEFLNQAQTCYRLYKALLPDGRGAQYYDRVKLYLMIADNIQTRRLEVDITDIIRRVEELLDDTIGTTGYDITATEPMDLSKIDFDKLAEHFAQGQKRHAIDLLQQLLQDRVNRMFEMNRTRIDLVEKFKTMIDEYNAGSHSLEEIYQDLLDFAQKLDEEDARAVREGLENEEELVIYDLLTKPEPKLNKQEQAEVKKVARALLPKLKELLVLGWRAKEYARAQVQVAIEETLDLLPPVYDKRLFDQKTNSIFSHVFDAYEGEFDSIYEKL